MLRRKNHVRCPCPLNIVFAICLFTCVRGHESGMPDGLSTNTPTYVAKPSSALNLLRRVPDFRNVVFVPHQLKLAHNITLRLMAITARTVVQGDHKRDLSHRLFLKGRLQITESWLFDGMKRRRHHITIECLWAGIQICLSALFPYPS